MSLFTETLTDRSIRSRLGARLRPSQVYPRLGFIDQTPTQKLDRFVVPRHDSVRHKELLLLNSPIARLSTLQRPTRRRTNRSELFSPEVRAEPVQPDDRVADENVRIIRPSRVGQGLVNVLHSDPVLFVENRVGNSLFRGTGGARNPSVLNSSTATDRSDTRSRVPVYSSRFLDSVTPASDHNVFVRRLALACDVDVANRVLKPSPSCYDSQAVRAAAPFQPRDVSPGSPM